MKKKIIVIIYWKNICNINNINNYSSNYESSSSIGSDEEVIYDYIPFDRSNNEGDDENDQNWIIDTKNNKKVKKYTKRRNNYKNDDKNILYKYVNFEKKYLENNKEFNIDFINEYNIINL